MVISTGLYYFPKEYESTGVWENLYYTLRLFIFEHDFDRFPEMWPLILIYFLAPLITLSGVGTAVSYVLKISPSLRSRFMKDHAIICGMGKTGRLFANALKEKAVSVVGIDRVVDDTLRSWCAGKLSSLINGEFLLAATLRKAGVAKARAVIFASGNDLVNLEGALAAYDEMKTTTGKPRIIWTQITDEQLAETARFFLRTRGKVGIRLYDTYRIAAKKMIGTYFHGELRKGIDEVDILGFGKFGRDLAEVMIRDFSAEEPINIRIVDIMDCRSSVEHLSEDQNFNGKVLFKRMDIRNLPVIYKPGKAYFICTDDDLKNLTVAMSLARKTEVTHVYVRMGHWPLAAVSEQIGKDHGISFVNINELVTEGISDMSGIFESARLTDLKRAE